MCRTTRQTEKFCPRGSFELLLDAAPASFPPKQNPQRELGVLRFKAPGDDLLLHGLSHTTIGAVAFHFRVREGIGWFHNAMITRETVGGSRLNGFPLFTRTLSRSVLQLRGT
jgi:hypothetical protein